MEQINYLDQILVYKKREIEILLKRIDKDHNHPLHTILGQDRTSNALFSSALKKESFAVIAEIKRRSPSLGNIRQISDPLQLALDYCSGGASAISVLTDPRSFGGSLADLRLIADGIFEQYPLLRKDFIIHPVQLAEAVLAGSQAVLLISRVLGKNLPKLIKEAKRLGLETLTEVHDRADLDLALEAEAPIIGVNHRNLQTFQIDLNISKILRPLIPNQVITVAESGIYLPSQAHLMKELGYNAVLVGEALVRAENPAKLIQEMKGVKNES